MTTRYTAISQPRFGVPGLPSGYQSKSTPDITIPSVGLKDVDKALFDLFNEQIPLVVGGGNTASKRVPVVFFAGEKWALNKRLRGLKDRNGALILPLITAVRTVVMQDPVMDITGRGINQQTGEIVIHRRLDKSDRAYQQLINRLLLRHQPNLAVNPSQADSGQLSTVRAIGDLAEDPVVQQGGLLVPDRTNNVYETIVVPAPQFFTAQYDFTFWTQYSEHMTQLIEALMNSFLPQGNAWRLDTPKGYWFSATVDSNQYNAELNADDYSQEERLIRYKFVVKVQGYIMASGVPGAPVPIKRYVSSPQISFQTGVVGNVETGSGGQDDLFLGADDPTLPLDDGSDGLSRRDQRRRNDTRLFPQQDVTNSDDPLAKQLKRGRQPAQFKKVTGLDRNGRMVTRYFRVTSSNPFTGETVLSPGADMGELSIVVTED
jgi:hypothetical protein